MWYTYTTRSVWKHYILYNPFLCVTLCATCVPDAPYLVTIIFKKRGKGGGMKQMTAETSSSLSFPTTLSSTHALVSATGMYKRLLVPY